MDGTGRIREIGGRWPDPEDVDGIPVGKSVFFEELFSSSPEGIVIYDRDGRIRKVNEAFCHLFGYNPEEVIGTDLDGLVATGRYYEEARLLPRQTWQEKGPVRRRDGPGVMDPFST